jgi:fatty-acyl-CoA synthase
MPWNFGDILDTIIPVLAPGHPALIHGERVLSWQEVDKRSNNLGRALLDAGLPPGTSVGFYLRNGPEYMETLAACFRARLVHANVNYRYQPDELHHILANSDAGAVVYNAEFRGNIEQLRDRLPKVKLWVEVSDETAGDCPRWATDYEYLARTGSGVNIPLERSGDDLLLLYTGGTTGLPKGVMWDNHNLREAQSLALRALGPVPENLEELRQSILDSGPGLCMLPACPLMHGTGLFTAMGAFFSGGTVVTLPARTLDPHAVWAAVEQHGVQQLAIVGDTFARPLVAVLEEQPGRYQLGQLRSIISSGVMFSTEVKQRLLERLPQIMIADSFGASEAVGFGASIMTRENQARTAQFITNDYCKVFDAEDRELPRGSQVPGFIAFGGPIPRGYYKDEEKTASTFKTINGHRYAIPGDYCLVSKDGVVTLLGRGSVCINSGGEKIYPEEVEEALKLHEDVDDALVVGLPDPDWGQMVTAVVQLRPGAGVDEAALIDFVKQRLAPYKAPKRVLGDAPPFRAPNGKADYKSARQFAAETLGR